LPAAWLLLRRRDRFTPGSLVPSRWSARVQSSVRGPNVAWRIPWFAGHGKRRGEARGRMGRP
jgi:hypothetical protein